MAEWTPDGADLAYADSADPQSVVPTSLRVVAADGTRERVLGTFVTPISDLAVRAYR